MVGNNENEIGNNENEIGNNENENDNNENENDNNNNCGNNNNKNNENNSSSENDDGTKSIVLNLVKLSKEYDIVLIKYNQAQKDYINYLKTQSGTMACKKYNSDSKEIDQACYEEIWKKAGCTTTGVVDASTDWAKESTLNGLIYDAFLWATMTDTDHRNGCYGTTTDTSIYNTATEPNYNINTEPLIDIKGATFWGTGLISEGESNSVDECKALCSADESCTGATYNSDKAYCWIRSGEGSVNTGLPNDYAIIPENLKYLKVIQGLSEKLTSINDEVLQAMNKGNPLYSAQDMSRKKQTAILNLNYKKLTKEREKVEETIKKYQELNKSQNLGYTFINQNYSTFITTVIIVIILIILFIKFLPTQTVETVQQGGGLKNNKYILILILTMCFVTFLIWNKFLVRQNCPLLQKNTKNTKK
jgi:hypothetical protein